MSRRPKNEEGEWPSVSLIISAYNEDAVLEQKINNSLAIDYPEEKLNIIFVTDGSNDASVNLINDHPAVQLLHQPERQGKICSHQKSHAVGANTGRGFQ